MLRNLRVINPLIHTIRKTYKEIKVQNKVSMLNMINEEENYSKIKRTVNDNY